MSLVKSTAESPLPFSVKVLRKRGKTAAKLIRDGRANYMAPADYTEGSQMEKIVSSVIDHMKADLALEKLEVSAKTKTKSIL